MYSSMRHVAPVVDVTFHLCHRAGSSYLRLDECKSIGAAARLKLLNQRRSGFWWPHTATQQSAHTGRWSNKGHHRLRSVRQICPPEEEVFTAPRGCSRHARLCSRAAAALASALGAAATLTSALDAAAALASARGAAATPLPPLAPPPSVQPQPRAAALCAASAARPRFDARALVASSPSCGCAVCCAACVCVCGVCADVRPRLARTSLLSALSRFDCDAFLCLPIFQTFSKKKTSFPNTSQTRSSPLCVLSSCFFCAG